MRRPRSTTGRLLLLSSLLLLTGLTRRRTATAQYVPSKDFADGLEEREFTAATAPTLYVINAASDIHAPHQVEPARHVLQIIADPGEIESAMWAAHGAFQPGKVIAVQVRTSVLFEPLDERAFSRTYADFTQPGTVYATRDGKGDLRGGRRLCRLRNSHPDRRRWSRQLLQFAARSGAMA